MKEEGRGPSVFPFLPPASSRPSNPGGWGRANSTCLLLIKPWASVYRVASRAVLGSQEHFREQRFHQREEKQSRDCPLEKKNKQQNSLDLCLGLLSWLTPSWSCWQGPKVTLLREVCVLFPPTSWLCSQSELGPWRLSSSLHRWRQLGQLMQPLALPLSCSLGFMS